MKIAYALQPLDKSIFLAGPTPRPHKPVPSWRPEAIAMLRDELGFTGTVFVPESADGKPHDEYLHQVSWEWEGLNQCTVAAFWIPRVLETMPAMTTNVEFGLVAASGKMVLGAPPEAEKIGYLHELAARFNAPIYKTMRETLEEAVRRTRVPFGRHGVAR